jgi:hypothetical protein
MSFYKNAFFTSEYEFQHKAFSFHEQKKSDLTKAAQRGAEVDRGSIKE